MEYKDLNEDDIRKAISPMFEKVSEDKEMGYVGELDDEQKARLFRIFPHFMISGLGEKLYRLPGGAITGQGGWNLFLEEFKKQALNNGFSTSSDR